jgi:mRNA interferase MazF
LEITNCKNGSELCSLPFYCYGVQIVKKDFDNWNEKKKLLEFRDKQFLFNTADIWWCSVGLNVSAESCGKGDDFQRPVLILKKLSKTNCIGIPLSTKEKVGSWFIGITVHGEKRYALLYQMRMFSTNRFQRRLATLDDADFCRVKEKLGLLLELSNHHQDLSPGSVGESQK